jgi:thiol-disulfide isomerase/thioredoxin
MQKSPNSGRFFLAVFLALGFALRTYAATEETLELAPEGPAADGEMVRLKMELGRVGSQLGKTQDPAEMTGHNLRQAELLAHIINRSPSTEQPALVRRMADCLIAAAATSAAGDTRARERLVRLEGQIARALPGGELAAYITYREIQVDYTARQTAPGADLTRVQEVRRGRLASFVVAYPSAPDAPAALLELGALSESLGKDDEAKEWYELVFRRSPGTALAFKAQGARRRLALEGKFLFVNLSLLDAANNAQPFDMQQLRGKVVVVYFWASWDPHCQHDFTELNHLRARHGPAGLEVVAVNLDATPQEARAFLKETALDAVHLYQPDGLDGTLATRYGVTALPTIFLVDKSGKVLRRNASLTSLDGQIQQALGQ